MERGLSLFYWAAVKTKQGPESDRSRPLLLVALSPLTCQPVSQGPACPAPSSADDSPDSSQSGPPLRSLPWLLTRGENRSPGGRSELPVSIFLYSGFFLSPNVVWTWFAVVFFRSEIANALTSFKLRACVCTRLNNTKN